MMDFTRREFDNKSQSSQKSFQSGVPPLARMQQKVARLEMTLRDREAELVKVYSSTKATVVNELKVQTEMYYQEVLRLRNQLNLLQQQQFGQSLTPYQETTEDLSNRKSPLSRTRRKSGGDIQFMNDDKLKDLVDTLKEENRQLSAKLSSFEDSRNNKNKINGQNGIHSDESFNLLKSQLEELKAREKLWEEERVNFKDLVGNLKEDRVFYKEISQKKEEELLSLQKELAKLRKDVLIVQKEMGIFNINGKPLCAHCSKSNFQNLKSIKKTLTENERARVNNSIPPSSKSKSRTPRSYKSLPGKGQKINSNISRSGTKSPSNKENTKYDRHSKGGRNCPVSSSATSSSLSSAHTSPTHSNNGIQKGLKTSETAQGSLSLERSSEAASPDSSYHPSPSKVKEKDEEIISKEGSNVNRSSKINSPPKTSGINLSSTQDTSKVSTIFNPKTPSSPAKSKSAQSKITPPTSVQSSQKLSLSSPSKGVKNSSQKTTKAPPSLHKSPGRSLPSQNVPLKPLIKSPKHKCLDAISSSLDKEEDKKVAQEILRGLDSSGLGESINKKYLSEVSLSLDSKDDLTIEINNRVNDDRTDCEVKGESTSSEMKRDMVESKTISEDHLMAIVEAHKVRKLKLNQLNLTKKSSPSSSKVKKRESKKKSIVTSQLSQETQDGIEDMVSILESHIARKAFLSLVAEQS